MLKRLAIHYLSLNLIWVFIVYAGKISLGLLKALLMCQAVHSLMKHQALG